MSTSYAAGSTMRGCRRGSSAQCEHDRGARVPSRMSRHHRRPARTSGSTRRDGCPFTGNRYEEERAAMKSSLRRVRSKKWATFVLIAMTLSPQGRPLFEATVSAQTTPPTIQVPPTGAGMSLVPEDLRFIFHQIEV